MSISNMVYVRCDRCGNPCGGQDDLRDSAQAARSRAKSLGWKRQLPREADEFYAVRHGNRMVDICPDCQDDAT